MCRMDYRGMEMESLVSYGIRWSWHTSCGNCGCEANWHAFRIVNGETMVALPEKFPCQGFEFDGCPNNCGDFEFQPPVATVLPAHQQWEKIKAARAMQNSGDDGGESDG